VTLEHICLNVHSVAELARKVSLYANQSRGHVDENTVFL